MRRTAQIVTVALLVAAVAMVPVGALAADGSVAQQDNSTDAQTPTERGNASENAVAPGERLSGILGVGQAELENEVDSRSFGLAVARAASDDAKADVVGEQLDDVEQRLDDLEQRKADLAAARENGSLSEGAYRARMAEVAAELEGAERVANQTANESAGLPADLLEQKGINASAIQTLKDRANELGGQEVAEIARAIAGSSVGTAPDHAGPDRRSPGDRGPDAPTDGNATDRNATDRGPDNVTDRGGQQTPERTTQETPDGDDGNDSTTTDDGSQQDAAGSDPGGRP